MLIDKGDTQTKQRKRNAVICCWTVLYNRPPNLWRLWFHSSTTWSMKVKGGCSKYLIAPCLLASVLSLKNAIFLSLTLNNLPGILTRLFAVIRASFNFFFILDYWYIFILILHTYQYLYNKYKEYCIHYYYYYYSTNCTIKILFNKLILYKVKNRFFIIKCCNHIIFQMSMGAHLL